MTLDQQIEAEVTGHVQGIRANIGQFAQQLLQVFFVGLTIGLQRNVVPVLAETEFGVPAGSFALLMAFIVSFGFVKGAMNLVSGRVSERVGRHRVLIWGWLAALPIPFILLWAPTWNWIVAANILLGVNQGFAWSMTVTAKLDLVRANQRGLATGLNEFSGYGGVALAGLLTGYLAAGFEPRLSLFWFGMAVILLGLGSALLFSKDTRPWTRAEAARRKQEAVGRGALADAHDLPEQPTLGQVFRLVTWRDGTFRALSQAGCVEKFVDALVWGLFPVFLHARGLTLIEIGWVVGVYGFVWGGSQLWTGPLSDNVGRKWPIVIGMWGCALGIVLFVMVSDLVSWSMAAAVMGVGMALLYPTLIAAVGDISHPNWRGTSLGVYRFWRDLGYGIGGLLIGGVAQLGGNILTGFWITAAAMVLSGFWVALAVQETLDTSA